jgi:hypothetical protein
MAIARQGETARAAREATANKRANIVFFRIFVERGRNN